VALREAIAAALVATGVVAILIGAPTWMVAVVAAALFAGTATRRHRMQNAVRVAVLGSRAATEALAAQLADRGVTGYNIIGNISAAEDAGADGPPLGSLPDLRTLVEQHAIELLLLAGDVPRLAVFDQLAASCHDLPVRLCELSAFYETRFGHVPVADVNSAWFQCILHPRHRVAPPRSKRVLDVALALVCGLICLPVLLLAALLIRRDGGPALYRQVRIGEGGRPFVMLKLRTMQLLPDSETTWSHADDARVTAVGRLLRSSHVDELPQLINVLRGEMSMVGPRPEQPHYVTYLERVLLFYSRRHQLRPGLTGWAQVRCGYAGSENGTAWKLAHDLYYLRHRSLRLDARILVETCWAAWRTPQFDELFETPFVVARRAQLEIAGESADSPGVAM